MNKKEERQSSNHPDSIWSSKTRMSWRGFIINRDMQLGIIAMMVLITKMKMENMTGILLQMDKMITNDQEMISETQ